MSDTAPIGITMGDPAGVGPEITSKVLAEMRPDERAATVVIGGRETMEWARALVGARLFRDVADWFGGRGPDKKGDAT